MEDMNQQGIQSYEQQRLQDVWYETEKRLRTNQNVANQPLMSRSVRQGLTKGLTEWKKGLKDERTHHTHLASKPFCCF